jgi:phage antirepressor YoqD-like protein
LWHRIIVCFLTPITALKKVNAINQKTNMMSNTKKAKESTQSETWYTVSQAAKLINKMGRNKLYEFLRNAGILLHHNEPYQAYCDRGYFKLEQVPKYNRWGQLFKYFPVLYVSPAGIMFIQGLLANEEAEKVSNDETSSQ